MAIICLKNLGCKDSVSFNGLQYLTLVIIGLLSMVRGAADRRRIRLDACVWLKGLVDIARKISQADK